MDWKTYISAMSTIEKYARNGKNFNRFSTRTSDWEFSSDDNIKITVYDDTFIVPLTKILRTGKVSVKDLISKTEEFIANLCKRYKMERKDIVDFSMYPDYVTISYKDRRGEKQSANTGYNFLPLEEELSKGIKSNPYKVMDFTYEELNYLYSKPNYADFRYSLIDRELVYCGFSSLASFVKDGIEHLFYAHPSGGVSYLYKRLNKDACNGIYLLETSRGLFNFSHVNINWNGNGSISYSYAHPWVSKELNKGYIYCSGEFKKGIHEEDSINLVLSYIPGKSYEERLFIFKSLLSNVSEEYISKL